jgi:hypothetical protein
MVFETAANDADVVGQQGRCQGISLEARVILAIEAEA